MNVIKVYSTLVHEQCHIWQHSLGKPSRTGYHNKEFAKKMESVGLIASTTGRPGGKQVGQKMSDYPIESGVFLRALNNMPETFKLPFISIEGEVKKRAQNPVSGISALIQGAYNEQTPPPPKPNKNKVKYSCPSCEINVWGKLNAKRRDASQHPFQTQCIKETIRRNYSIDVLA